jgi:hypothetical protein
MTTLNETPVPFSSEIKRPEAARSVLRLFADHGWAARVWFVIAVVAVAAAFIQPFFIISAFRTQERVVVLDESGTYHISPLLDFEDATKLQTSQALLACLALLEKNPTGFDYPELLEKMYLPDALNQAKAMQSQEADELEAKSWLPSKASSSGSVSSMASPSPRPKNFTRSSPFFVTPTSLPTADSPSLSGNSISSSSPTSHPFYEFSFVYTSTSLFVRPRIGGPPRPWRAFSRRRFDLRAQRLVRVANFTGPNLK